MQQESKSSAVVGEFAQWLVALRAQGRSPRTVQTYRSAVQNLTRYLDRRQLTHLTAVEPRHLDDWRRELMRTGCTAATVDLFVRTIRGAFRWLVQTGCLFLNPAERLTAPKVPQRVLRIPSEAEMSRVLESIPLRDPAGRRDLAILETAYATGARLEELVRLDLGSVDFANGLLRLHGKGDRERLAPLTGTALAALEIYLHCARPALARGSDALALFLSTRGGGRLGFCSIEAVVRRRAAGVGIDLTPHAIRRAFATHLLRAGAGPAEIRELLGHRSYRHLRHYLQGSPGEMTATLKRARPCRR